MGVWGTHNPQNQTKRFFDCVAARPEERDARTKAGRHFAQNDGLTLLVLPKKKSRSLTAVPDKNGQGRVRDDNSP